LAVQFLREEIPRDLTVRRVAAAASTTTMSLCTGFGKRDGLLDVVYAPGWSSSCAKAWNPLPWWPTRRRRCVSATGPTARSRWPTRARTGCCSSASPRLRSQPRGAQQCRVAPPSACAPPRLGVCWGRTPEIHGPRARLHAVGADPRPGQPGAVACPTAVCWRIRCSRRPMAGRYRHGAAGGDVGLAPERSRRLRGRLKPSNDPTSATVAGVIGATCDGGGGAWPAVVPQSRGPRCGGTTPRGEGRSGVRTEGSRSRRNS
jgi:hypothetical protein